MREEPVGSGRVVVLGRAPGQGAQGQGQGGGEFGEWATHRRGDVRLRSP